MTSVQATESLKCANCGGGWRKHDVLFSKEETWRADDYGEDGYSIYIVARCRGCETIRFALKTWDTSMYFDESGSANEHIRTFPESVETKQRPAALDVFDLPSKVGHMYQETLKAYDAGAYTLCGAGLRGIVEALCLDQGIVNGSLESKINGLVKGGHLAAKQAEHLHEERYLGNAAVHEMEKPSSKDLEDGLQIIEGLLRTIYILPQHAENMKLRRETRKARKAKAKAMAVPNTSAVILSAGPPAPKDGKPTRKRVAPSD